MVDDQNVKLQVLICTTADGLHRLCSGKLPRIDHVGWIVSCQDPYGKAMQTDFTELIERTDVELHMYGDQGLSVNRNHAFVASSAPYLLIADDDLTYHSEALTQIIDLFDTHTDTDIVLLHANLGRPRTMPPDGVRLIATWPHHSPLSFEIAMRRTTTVDRGLRFTPLAGIGASKLGCGEEELLIAKARRMGLTVRYFDIRHVDHLHPTTSVRSAADSRVVRAKGAVMAADRGAITALTRIPIEAFRSSMSTPKAMVTLIEGWLYYLKHRRNL